MKKLLIILTAAACLLLAGCSWLDGHYASVSPHEDHSQNVQDYSVTARDYRQLRQALEALIEDGQSSGLIYVPDFDQDLVSKSMEMAIRYVCNTFPLGAYAVDEISYEPGTNGGRPAVAVEIQYRRSDVEIRKIRRVEDMHSATEVISQILEAHEAGVVLLIEEYESADIAQMVESYALEYPDKIMEVPQVVVGLYPETGVSRVMEVQFTYQNSRDTLRQMQQQTQQLFTSAEMYVSLDADDRTKLSQLYTFLMERFDYKLDTSITPAYSLLRHGVGDSRAFSTVYAAMCRRVGLECHVVTGTRSGEPWYWNIVCDGGLYFHVDLLRSGGSGSFREMLDEEMTGYVWDYSGYPVCNQRHATEETVKTPTDAPETDPTAESSENIS